MAKTKASVKDGRLTIFTGDAIEPGVVGLALNDAVAGSFEVSNEANGAALMFKPQGRKTADKLAVYTTRKKADAALREVFGALSGKSSSTLLGKIGRYALYAAGVLFGLWLLLFILGLIVAATMTSGPMPTADVQGAATVEPQPLPVGEPFPVDDYVQQLQDASTTE